MSIKFTPSSRHGLTLIEILIALTMTLIVLGAMMQAFQYASAEMQNGRATLELSNRMRVAENLLRRDLANLTVEPRPYIGKVIPNGYFEYIEGPLRDLQPPFGVDDDLDGVPNALDDDPGTAATTGSGLQEPFYEYGYATVPPPDRPFYQPADPRNPENSYLGDVDDILAMTVRSIAGQTFRGRVYYTTLDTNGDGTQDDPSFDPTDATPAGDITQTVESSFAEVVWWTQLKDNDADNAVGYNDTVAIFRRVLIINPDIAGLPTGINYATARCWMAASDVSVRLVPVGGAFNIVANSLEDLSTRANRFARIGPAGYEHPFPLNRGTLFTTRSADWQRVATGGIGFPGTTTANGNDIVLSDIAAFDVKTFSPDAYTYLDPTTSVLLEPSAPGFATRYRGGGFPFSCSTDPVTLLPGAVQSGAFVDLAHFGSGQFSHPAGTVPEGWYVPGMPATTVDKGLLYYQFNFQDVAKFAASAPGIGSLPAVQSGLLDVAYDTWTPVYESDGINQDPNMANSSLYNPTTGAPGVLAVNSGDATADEGTNGIDDDNANGPDDFFERETRPPYGDPIRGLRVTLRLIEKQTGQVKQSSITQSYNQE